METREQKTREPETRGLVIRDLGRTRYRPVFRAMRDFTDARTSATIDELWLTEHEPVFTQGQAGRAEYILDPGDIPVVQTDRGGQVTYHGPGQIVGYLLFDLRRLGLNVRGLVDGIEQSIIEVLSGFGIEARARRDAPGVYVRGEKIAALGLRVRRGCSYHGLALNVDMDVEPFTRINPCGLGVSVTSMRTLLPGASSAGGVSLADVRERLATVLSRRFGFGAVTRKLDSGGFWAA